MKNSFIKLVLALITALATGAGIFWGGFSLGDKWSGVKKDHLVLEIKNLNQEINLLNEKIFLLKKDKPELQELYDLIRRDQITYLGTTSISSDYQKKKKIILYDRNAKEWKDGVYLTFIGNRINNTIQSSRYKLNISGINIDNQSVELEMGHSVLLLLNNKKHILFLDEYSIQNKRTYYITLDVFEEI